CTTNQECIALNGGNAAVCLHPQSVCQPLQTASCPKVLGSVTDDDVILLGLVQDLRGANAGTGNAGVNAAELALSEITGTARGVPVAQGGRPRPLAIVACSENPDATSAADPLVPGGFLVETLGVPAILGAGNSDTTIDLATNLTLPN